MKKVILMIYCFILISCEENNNPLYPDRPLDQLELKFIDTFSYDEAIIYKSCRAGKYNKSIEKCLENIANSRMPQQPVQKDSNGNILGTAAGVTLGIGAAKLLFGK